ncbi:MULTISPECIES: phenylacetate--CoA ligase [Geobacillus]|nr:MULTISPECIES: phenylacetate--CoA ligase [Geobacillus]
MILHDIETAARSELEALQLERLRADDGAHVAGQRAG